jgi:predicted DNA-binding transcriptional regulator YafY
MSSAKTVHRLFRILSMLPWVIANPGSTVGEVVERFKYSSPRQLASDLDLVFVCGLPGYGPGELMVAYIDDDEVVVELADYFSRPIRLTPPEALQLIGAGRAVLSSGAAPEALASAVEKLEQMLFADADQLLTVDLSEPPLLNDLRRVVESRGVIEITYTALGTGETTVREVEPWQLQSSLGNWYLTAWCRRADAERVFRIDRIQRLEVVGGDAVAARRQDSVPVGYSPDAGETIATLRLSDRARWVSQYYPVEIVNDDEDGVVVRLSAYDPKVAAKLLIRLGAHAELLDGERVSAARDELRDEILSRYADTAAS